jgi:hypothetical protein
MNDEIKRLKFSVENKNVKRMIYLKKKKGIKKAVCNDSYLKSQPLRRQKVK